MKYKILNTSIVFLLLKILIIAVILITARMFWVKYINYYINYVNIILLGTIIIYSVIIFEKEYIRYYFTSKHLKIKKGFINIRIDYTEYYRINDFRIDKPILLRLFGLENIIIFTMDRSEGTYKMKYVNAQKEQFYQALRKFINKSRNENKILENI